MTRLIRWPLLAWVLGLAACTSPGEDPSVGKIGATPTPPLEIATPDWPSDSEIDLTALGRLPKDARLAIDESPVPALVPRDVPLLEAGLITTGEHFYAFSATAGVSNVAVHATRAAHRYDHVEPPMPGNRAIRGTDGFVGRNEGIWSATWMERGVAYSLDLECARLDHELCKSERYLLELVESLAYVGGAR